MNFLLVFIGAGIGGALRHGVNVAAASIIGVAPIGTLFINCTGSLIMGIAAELWALKTGLPQHARLFITTGILGGFTTFSTFSLEAALLWERGQILAAIAYASASVVLSIGALFGGLWLIRTLVGRGIL
jgi:CrcB protein